MLTVMFGVAFISQDKQCILAIYGGPFECSAHVEQMGELNVIFSTCTSMHYGYGGWLGKLLDIA